MSTKAQIISKINTDLASVSDITAAEHRGVLHTSEDSILEAFYGSVITEDSAATHTITTPNAAFSYLVTVTKVGRNITLDGRFQVLATGFTIAGSKVLEIDALQTAFLGSGTSYSVATNNSSDQFIELRMVGNELQVNNTVAQGERFKFSITYKSLN